jgi:hypothetical protein
MSDLSLPPQPDPEPVVISFDPVPPYRCALRIPEALMKGIAQRMIDVRSVDFSWYVVELVCYDLRERGVHSFTRPLADADPGMQEAVDLVTVTTYDACKRRGRGAIQEILDNSSEEFRALKRSNQPLLPRRKWVNFPGRLAAAIEERWREQGYRSLSDHVVSLIRYDLLLGGRHRLFFGKDCTPEMLASLDIETLMTFELRKGRKKKFKAHYLVEEAAGMPMTIEECDTVLEAAMKKIIGQG